MVGKCRPPHPARLMHPARARQQDSPVHRAAGVSKEEQEQQEPVTCPAALPQLLAALRGGHTGCACCSRRGGGPATCAQCGGGMTVRKLSCVRGRCVGTFERWVDDDVTSADVHARARRPRCTLVGAREAEMAGSVNDIVLDWALDVWGHRRHADGPSPPRGPPAKPEGPVVLAACPAGAESCLGESQSGVWAGGWRMQNSGTQQSACWGWGGGAGRCPGMEGRSRLGCGPQCRASWEADTHQP